MISAAIYNAFITWKYSPHNCDIPNSYDLMMFTADVAEGLLNGFTSQKLPVRKATRATHVRPETIGHQVIEKISGRKKKKKKKKKKNSVYCALRNEIKLLKATLSKPVFITNFVRWLLVRESVSESTMKLALQLFKIPNNSIIRIDLINFNIVLLIVPFTSFNFFKLL